MYNPKKINDLNLIQLVNLITLGCYRTKGNVAMSKI